MAPDGLRRSAPAPAITPPGSRTGSAGTVRPRSRPTRRCTTSPGTTSRGRACTRTWSAATAWRAPRRSYGRIRDWYHGEEGERATTTLDPRVLEENPDARFAVGLRVRDAWPLLCPADDGSDEATYWLFDDARSSWATVEYVPGQDTYETEQHGPRRLWDDVESAYRAWTAEGAPTRDRYRITVTPEGQTVSL